MKQIVLIALILFSQMARGQDQGQKKFFDVLPMVNGKVVYTDVVPVEGVGKSELYLRAKKWIVDVYNSANSVIQMDDTASGMLVAKGTFAVNWNFKALVGTSVQVVDMAHQLTIQVKDGRYKYELKDLRVTYYWPASQYNAAQNVNFPIEDWQQKKNYNESKAFMVNVDAESRGLMTSLENYVQKPSFSNDW